MTSGAGGAVHKHGQTFYLSWGCFYATSTGSVYGPYTMQGAVIDTAKIAPDFQCDGQPHQCGKSTAPDADTSEPQRARAAALAQYHLRGIGIIATGIHELTEIDTRF
jgi:hypothetical protein